ncbi:hypothetical protein EUX98_g828 [Antrodiella citrinella]|uniref:Uncharacterized protein n=1 Tax=Antrodiella citrinella TaxID=2447956 RepID=A0A4S4N2Y1_9APHY|nr:hypothetical protein EUX98_g828 [Antrodiella citrinella]
MILLELFHLEREYCTITNYTLHFLIYSVLFYHPERFLPAIIPENDAPTTCFWITDDIQRFSTPSEQIYQLPVSTAKSMRAFAPRRKSNEIAALDPGLSTSIIGVIGVAGKKKGVRSSLNDEEPFVLM